MKTIGHSKNWEWKKCGDVIDVRDGTHDTPKYVNEGIPLITSKNLISGKIDFKDAQFISLEDHLKIQKRSGVNRGDILFAMIGTIGNPVIVEEESEFSIKNVALFKFTKNPVSPNFFKHLLLSDVIRKQIDRETRGGNQKFVSLNILRNLQIPLPPLPEQKRIAEVLDSADALREKRRLALSKLDSLLQSVFLEMFGDPVRNPKGWEIVSFEKLLDNPLRNGLSPSTNGTTFHQLLTLSAITRGIFNSSAVKDAYFEGNIPNDKYVSKDSFLICRGNGNLKMVGQGQFPTFDMPNTLFPDTMIAAQIDKSKIQPHFLKTIWSSPFVREQIESRARTTNGTFKINQKQLNQ